MDEDERNRIALEAKWKADVDSNLRALNSDIKFAKGAALAGIVAIGSKLFEYLSGRFLP